MDQNQNKTAQANREQPATNGGGSSMFFMILYRVAALSLMTFACWILWSINSNGIRVYPVGEPFQVEMDGRAIDVRVQNMPRIPSLPIYVDSRNQQYFLVRPID